MTRPLVADHDGAYALRAVSMLDLTDASRSIEGRAQTAHWEVIKRRISLRLTELNSWKLKADLANAAPTREERRRLNAQAQTHLDNSIGLEAESEREGLFLIRGGKS